MIRWLDPAPVRWLGAVEVADHPPTGTLADVVPEVRDEFETLVGHANLLGMQPKVRSAGRTCEQQQEQVALGYSHADLCRSMHVLGHALDLDLSPNTCDTYTKLGEWWEGRGGWGGRFPGFGPCGDSGHFQRGFGGAGAVPTSACPSGVTLEQCRKIRKAYLDAAFASGPTVRGAYLTVGLVIAGVVAVAWWLT
jgi:hypothetical protein